MSFNDMFELVRSTFEVLAIIVLLTIILAIVMYVFQAIALYSISKRRALGTSAFGWIPILSWIKIGQIADNAALMGSKKVCHYKWLLPIFMILGTICNLFVSYYYSKGNYLLYSEYEYTYNSGEMLLCLIISVVGAGLLITGLVFYYICLFYIYRSCSRGYVAMLVLSIIFSVLTPFFLFAIRKRINTDFYPVIGTYRYRYE